MRNGLKTKPEILVYDLEKLSLTPSFLRKALHSFYKRSDDRKPCSGRLDKYLVSPQDLKPGMTKKHLKNIPSPHPFKKKFLSQVIAEVFKRFKLAETSKTLDKLKDLGFKYSTVSGITVAISDIEVVSGKEEILGQADQMVDEYDKRYRRGFMTKEERKKLSTFDQSQEKVEENQK